MEVISDRIIKARKSHRCGLCGKEIASGTLYRHQFNKDGGNVWTFNAHCECMELTGVIDFGDYDGITNQEFNDALQSYAYEKHYDDAKDDIAAEWQNMSPYEAAKRTLKELKEANITYLRLNF